MIKNGKSFDKKIKVEGGYCPTEGNLKKPPRIKPEVKENKEHDTNGKKS